MCVHVLMRWTHSHTHAERQTSRGQGLPSMEASLSYRTCSINPEMVPANFEGCCLRQKVFRILQENTGRKLTRLMKCQ